MSSETAQPANGVLQCLQKGGGFLRDPLRSFQPGTADVWVSSKIIREFGLADGAYIVGSSQRGKKGAQLDGIDTVCGLAPVDFRTRKRFDRLTAIDPSDRFRLGDAGNVSMRIVELIAPIGRGTRGLIVAPPKTGKTQILEDIANAIYASEPETRIIVLLIDERPEEVTHFRRNVHGEVLASSNDQGMQSHINLAELALAHIRCELECSRHIVVLVDSITRMARAFNKLNTGGSRTLSGGLGAQALDIPRRFFGLARNVENGGSVTVIATALIDTGSRMDDYIFEEFKGTGNSEIVLDRTLSDSRVFPAINIRASGTRKEELLYSYEDIQALRVLRRGLADDEPLAAMLNLLKLIQMEPTNAELLQKMKPRR